MPPDFLVIGAQKSGTTWLDRNLRRHPNIWLPPEKEIHYFDFPPLIPFYFALFAGSRHIRCWAQYRLSRDIKKVRNGEQSLAWYVRYYFFVRTRGWYLSLFTPNPGQLAGEITPGYAILKASQIAKIHALMPQAKLVYLLRDPIERIWSDVAMFNSARFGGQGLANTDSDLVQRFLHNATNIANSRYPQNLSQWESFFGKEQIFVGFQEQIRDEPVRLIQDIFRFLGVDDSETHITDLAFQKINSHDHPDIPQSLAYRLAALFLADLEVLHERFQNDYTSLWLANAQGYLARGPG